MFISSANTSYFLYAQHWARYRDTKKKKFHFIFVLRETAIVERFKIQTNKQIKLWGKEHTAYGVLPVGGLLGTPVPASSNAQGEGIQ